MFKQFTLAAASFVLCAGLAQAADDKKTTDKAPSKPQQTRMAECNKEAGDMKGSERKAFMKTCLSTKAGNQQAKMKTCNKEAGDKALKGDERKAFMKSCLAA